MSHIDLQFQLTGDYLPADHGFHLYSAISDVVPALHGNDRIGVHMVNGRLTGDRRISLTARSRLGIRIPLELIPAALPLAGQSLQVGPYRIQVGVPRTSSLQHRSRLYSRLVVIKGFMEPEPFLDACRRQLAKLEIRGSPSLVLSPRFAGVGQNDENNSPWLRRTLNIHGREIVGFAVLVEELTAEESIRLQDRGIGGRRRFGCGLFLPARGG